MVTNTVNLNTQHRESLPEIIQKQPSKEACVLIYSYARKHLVSYSESRFMVIFTDDKLPDTRSLGEGLYITKHKGRLVVPLSFFDAVVNMFLGEELICKWWENYEDVKGQKKVWFEIPTCYGKQYNTVEEYVRALCKIDGFKYNPEFFTPHGLRRLSNGVIRANRLESQELKRSWYHIFI